MHQRVRFIPFIPTLLNTKILDCVVPPPRGFPLDHLSLCQQKEALMMRIEPVLQKTCSFTRQNKLTGSQRVSLRTPSSKNLHSCTAQRSRERWGIPPGGGRSGWTPPAGWWRSQSELLRSSWGRTVLSGAPAFYRSTGRRHTTVLSNKNAVYCLLLKALQNHFQRWNLTDHLNTPCLCLHLCVHTSSGSWKKNKATISRWRWILSLQLSRHQRLLTS